MAKLYKADVNKEIEKFTVGDDYILDAKLLKYDIKASIAHAKMLEKIAILKKDELAKLVKELQIIEKLALNNQFKIKMEDEDCHTAIENHLTEKLGELGKKIHTFRSRNDQIKAALNLYSKEELNMTEETVLALITSLKKFSKHDIAIPGYTHYQKAMPSSFKLWSEAFIAAFEDDLKLIRTAYSIVNTNPLGSAAGYGVPYDIDRDVTKEELGFAANQAIGYVQNSRGKFESIIINALTQVMLDLNKIASDLILFNLMKFVELPEDFTTGSSIMPQKKNPDVLELIRAKYAVVLGYEFSVKNLVSNLISGYHRDFQLTKDPLMKSFEITETSSKLMTMVIERLKINKENCKKAMTKELFATEEAYKLVKEGMSFRDAYEKVKRNL